MPRIIFKCPHIKPGSKKAAAHLSNYVRYVATRQGVELLSPAKASRPATKKQQAMVEQLLREFPMSRGMFEYEDYAAAPTRGNASEFITRAIEDNYDQIAKRENYVGYIAQRPRAERIGSHGLFNGTGDTLTLSRVAEEVANHPGNVWLPIISLRREDAARLGYDNARQWQAFLQGCAPQMAEAMKIPLEQFRWYASFHDEGTHPHVHMVCYSADGKSGFLTKEGIAKIKSGMAKEIFRQDLTAVYQEQTLRRDELVQKSGEVMDELVQQMRSGSLENPQIEQLMEFLSEKLKNTRGKKQYGYLKATLKTVVDEIVDELAKDTRIATAYDLWYRLREEVLRTYKDNLPERLPLSQQKEFKRIKTLVIEEAVRLGEFNEVFAPTDTTESVEQIASEIEPDANPEPDDSQTAVDIPEPADAPPTVNWSDRYKQARSFLFGDENGTQDYEKAYDLLTEEALGGNALAMYDLGRIFADGLGRDRDAEQAQVWYAKALDAFRAVDEKRPARYVEYRIGLMLQRGIGTSRDEAVAQEWFKKSAKRGNPHAQYQMAKSLFADSASRQEQIAEAVSWLTSAAEAGLDYAQYALGKLYRDGGPVEQDTLQAVIWFTQAAERGNQYAMYALGKLHQEAENFPAALRWFQRSAELENQYAQYRLGKLLLSGEGTAKDAENAVRWLTESAEQGNQYAQYALGKLYLLGKDVLQDQDAATHWFTLAAAQGNEYAQHYLKRMHDQPSLLSSASRLLHHMGNIFQEQTPRSAGGIAFVDSKLRQKIREKKIAMGHKADDHEEHAQQL